MADASSIAVPGDGVTADSTARPKKEEGDEGDSGRGSGDYLTAVWVYLGAKEACAPHPGALPMQAVSPARAPPWRLVAVTLISEDPNNFPSRPALSVPVQCSECMWLCSGSGGMLGRVLRRLGAVEGLSQGGVTDGRCCGRCAQASVCAVQGSVFAVGSVVRLRAVAVGVWADVPGCAVTCLMKTSFAPESATWRRAVLVMRLPR